MYEIKGGSTLVPIESRLAILDFFVRLASAIVKPHMFTETSHCLFDQHLMRLLYCTVSLFVGASVNLDMSRGADSGVGLNHRTFHTRGRTRKQD